ncbi:MAG TPA: YihY/virulence factor BrkB family protein [Pseudobdellovibrionaceae bacterium]|nr:YihY/virulence factor BrkB family protein [Pseudobdellovibrionaceae bacterium]
MSVVNETQATNTASAPATKTESPERWWRAVAQILADTFRRVRQVELKMVVGSLSYATVLAFVPLLAVSVSVFHLLGGFEKMLSLVGPFIASHLRETSGAGATKFLETALRRVHSGALGVSGAVVLLWISTRLFHEMESAVQRVCRVRRPRALWKRLGVYWAVMFAAPLVLAGLLGALGSRHLQLLAILPHTLIGVVVMLVALIAVYKWIPARPIQWGPALIGALSAATAFALVQASYAAVMKQLFRYSKVYGSLTGMILFLTWISVMWWIVLTGAALTAVLQERREQLAQSSGPAAARGEWGGPPDEKSDGQSGGPT